jgi:hypothetical protein
VKANPSDEKENVMQQFIEKYRDQIQGYLSGFDRLAFRGAPRRLNSCVWDPERKILVAKGMEEYLWQNKILFKDYGRHVARVSERVKHWSLKPFRDADLPILYERDPRVDKDLLAREQARKLGIRSGLVCAISTMEPNPTFDYIKSRIVRRTRPAHVLYHYQIHPQVGWMYARIQTWFPFNIQVGLNGREWLSRQMDEEGMKYEQVRNCFTWIEDYQRAQEWMSRQLTTNWTELLGGMAQVLNPLHDEIFAKYPTEYYWTCYQSEWATDIVFRDADSLRRLMSRLVTHGILRLDSADVLRFFGKRVNRSGEIPKNFHGEVQISYKRRPEGRRVKYWMEGNSLKTYDKAYSEQGNVLRAAETTINNVAVFRAYRAAEGGPPEDLKWRTMRKGIADLHRRVEVSQKANERLLDALASVDDSRSIEELASAIQKPTTWAGRRLRALQPWAEDHQLLAGILHGDFLINGFRNRDLQKLLYPTEAESKPEQRRRSAAISRKLRMLRAHKLIHKVPHTHRYHVAPNARTILVAIITTAQTTLDQLNALQKVA